jgi:hypothetical protein
MSAIKPYAWNRNKLPGIDTIAARKPRGAVNLAVAGHKGNRFAKPVTLPKVWGKKE